MRSLGAPSPVFVPSCEAAPGPALDAWLALRRDVVVRLPFTVWRGALGQVASAAIGRHHDPPASTLHLDDGALGISLADRLRHACGDDVRAVVSLSGRAARDGEFVVLGFHGRAPDDAGALAEEQRAVEHVVIRSLRSSHCARGPARCAACRDQAAKPAQPRLLDLAPAGPAARPVVGVVRDGVTTWRAYDVLRTFSDEDEARAFAAAHGISDVDLGPP